MRLLGKAIVALIVLILLLGACGCDKKKTQEELAREAAEKVSKEGEARRAEEDRQRKEAQEKAKRELVAELKKEQDALKVQQDALKVQQDALKAQEDAAKKREKDIEKLQEDVKKLQEEAATNLKVGIIEAKKALRKESLARFDADWARDRKGFEANVKNQNAMVHFYQGNRWAAPSTTLVQNAMALFESQYQVARQKFLAAIGDP